MLLNCGVGGNSWDCKESQPVHPKGNRYWIFIGKTDGEAETPVLWPPDEKNWLLGKDPNAGKDRRQEEKGTTENEVVGWHHWCNGHEFEQAPGVGDGQRSLVGYSPWDLKRVRQNWVTNWTDTNIEECCLRKYNGKIGVSRDYSGAYYEVGGAYYEVHIMKEHIMKCTVT